MGASELEIRMMSKRACADFLEKSVPLNATITKVASDMDLNQYQIARLCELANLDTFNSLFQKTGSGDFKFDLADQNAIISELNKVADLHMPDEYDMEAADLKDILPKTEKSAEAMTKEAAFVEALTEDKPISKARILKAANRAQNFLEEFDSAMFEAKTACENARIGLTEIIKSAALRGENISPVFEVAIAMCKTAEDEQAIKETFAKIANELLRNRIDIVKLAKVYSESATGAEASRVNNKVVAPKGKDMLINQEHPIMKHLDTLIKNYHDCNMAENKRTHIVKRVEVMRDKLISKKS